MATESEWVCIDFGTCNTAAAIEIDGKPHVVSYNNQQYFPTIVCVFDNGSIEVCQNAETFRTSIKKIKKQKVQPGPQGIKVSRQHWDKRCWMSFHHLRMNTKRMLCSIRYTLENWELARISPENFATYVESMAARFPRNWTRRLGHTYMLPLTLHLSEKNTGTKRFPENLPPKSANG